MNSATWETIKWWELRRIPYTISVGGVGVVSFFVANAIVGSYARVGEDFFKPVSLLIGVPFALVVANVFYTFGWITELLRKNATKEENRTFRIVSYYSGLALSAFAISLPMWMALLRWLRNA